MPFVPLQRKKNHIMAPKKKVSALIKLQIEAGKVTKDQVRKIAETKMADLSARDIDAAMKIIEGTARSMGITVND